MAKKRKFEKGANNLSTLEVIDEIQNGNWVFFHHKPMHPKFLECWTVRTIINNSGAFRPAIELKE